MEEERLPRIEKSLEGPFGFELIERKLRSKTFGILSTASKDGKPHSIGVVYSVSPKNKPFCLYLITRPVLKKARNIMQNPYVSFVVPFPHYLLPPLPQRCIQFQGNAEIISIDDPEATTTFERSIILRRSKEHSLKLGESIFIRLIPGEKIFSFGIAANVFKFLIPSQSKNLGNYFVTVPKDRRFG